MITETEHYILELIPRWARKKREYETVACPHCNGTGHDYTDELSIHWSECSWCFGSGTKQIPKELPPPPNIDMDFVSFMRKAFQEYRDKNQ
jgi:hypothetical protein